MVSAVEDRGGPSSLFLSSMSSSWIGSGGVVGTANESDSASASASDASLGCHSGASTSVNEAVGGEARAPSSMSMMLGPLSALAIDDIVI
ncbi:hypothetical protein ACHAXA_005790 [Cyclostephanos tholiformis]|uniref:Uncharacterized protein n=1 Tax=Cyclostephanos tholiformis TaxID=382380 RepID=A0ABD3R0F7_9STRA